jgi:hypothetical protein
MQTTQQPAGATIPDQKLMELCQFCIDNNYLSPRFIHTGRIACIMPLLYTGAIITLDPERYHICYEDRWCYHSVDDAKKALDAWTDGAESTGWHRHPSTGRRREDGNPLNEYINR